MKNMQRVKLTPKQKQYNRQANRENALKRGSWFGKRTSQILSPKRYTAPLSRTAQRSKTEKGDT